jgi:hypothetical protein
MRPEVKEIAQQAFLLFCHTRVTFLFEDRKIMIGDAEEVVMSIKNIDEIQYLEESEYMDF